MALIIKQSTEHKLEASKFWSELQKLRPMVKEMNDRNVFYY